MSQSDPLDRQVITARFYVAQLTEHGNVDQITVELNPAYSEGQNKAWAKATPSGKITLAIGSDLPAAEFFRSVLRDSEHNVAVEFSIVEKNQ